MRLGRPNETTFKRDVKILAEEIIRVLQMFPQERALDGLREKLEPVELYILPELREEARK